jgi:hypothetical protein
MQLYRKRGWQPLIQDFYFPGGIAPMVVMGLDLVKFNADVGTRLRS